MKEHEITVELRNHAELKNILTRAGVKIMMPGEMFTIGNTIYTVKVMYRIGKQPWTIFFLTNDVTSFAHRVSVTNESTVVYEAHPLYYDVTTNSALFNDEAIGSLSFIM